MSESTENQDRAEPTTRDQDTPASGSLPSITRLLIGGMLLGADVLSSRLPQWQQNADTSLREKGTRPSDVSLTQPGTEQSDQKAYALIGMLSDAEAFIQKSAATLESAERGAWKLMTPVHKPLRTWRLFAPARSRYDQLVARGEKQVTHWVDVGRTEGQRSQEMAEAALGDTVFESIGQVVEDPRLQQVITEGASSLSGEVADGIREKTVSADTLVEALVRRLFRRAPRAFPERPPVIFHAGIHTHTAEQRMEHKDL